jgi:hypothetical protein
MSQQLSPTSRLYSSIHSLRSLVSTKNGSNLAGKLTHIVSMGMQRKDSCNLRRKQKLSVHNLHGMQRKDHMGMQKKDGCNLGGSS